MNRSLCAHVMPDGTICKRTALHPMHRPETALHAFEPAKIVEQRTL